MRNVYVIEGAGVQVYSRDRNELVSFLTIDFDSPGLPASVTDRIKQVKISTAEFVALPELAVTDSVLSFGTASA